MLDGRTDFWNIGYPLLGAVVYFVAPIALAAIVYGMYRRVRIWRTAGAYGEMGDHPARIREFLRYSAIDLFWHRKFRSRERYAGYMHFAIFWGFSVLLVATTVAAVEFNTEEYLDWTFPTANFRLQTSLIWDVFGGGLAAVGLGMAAWRRYVIRPERLNTFADDGVVLLFLSGLLLTGFMIEGLRMGATELNPASALYDTSAAAWSPVGWLFAKALSGAGMTPAVMEDVHRVTWWSHAAIFTAGFVYTAVGFSKFSHIIISPLNSYFRPLRASGALRPMGDLETLETFGAKDLPDLTWQQVLSFDACTNCGRCQSQCPAYAADTPLSPRKLIQDMRRYAEERAPALYLTPEGQTPPEPARSMVHDAAGDDALWACTSCGSCVEACPVSINHIDMIVDMRRFLVLEEGSGPETALTAMQSIEQRGHPWTGTTLTRTGWMEGLDIPTLAEKPDAEVLFWVGCTGALVKRGVETTRAMVRVLKRAGVDFAVLGDEETCTGDPARRMGNEYLWQVQAEQNTKTFARYGVKKIVTTCPHCFNTIKNEYPQLGDSFEVEHYTAYVGRLLRDGRLKPGEGIVGSVSYHDSCYIARHNGMTEEPRYIMSQIPGLEVVEMSRSKEKTFCCGAGGGRMWMEDTGKRVNHIRTEQFIETGAGTVAVSCPFCIQMMDEGISAKGVADDKNAVDLITLLDRATGGGEATSSPT
ncbi:MAG: (Fe-S)-binding protein [Chloroflexi bacterium]|nr:(Fe-S)-binding protein [Chloroflexota bacterium]